MNKTNRTGLFTLLVIGGFVAYRNRASIQRVLERYGIKTPLDTSGKLVDTIRSGVAKIAGRSEFALNQSKDGIEQTG